MVRQFAEEETTTAGTFDASLRARARSGWATAPSIASGRPSSTIGASFVRGILLISLVDKETEDGSRRLGPCALIHAVTVPRSGQTPLQPRSRLPTLEV